MTILDLEKSTLFTLKGHTTRNLQIRSSGSDSTQTDSSESKILTKKMIDEIINQDLKTDEGLESLKVKLLILGTSNCGKSTVFKQMKMIYGVKYSARQRKLTIPLIHRNITVFMKTICEAVLLFDYVSIVESKQEFESFLYKNEDDSIDLITTQCIKKLWNDPAIQKAWLRRNELQIIESTKYFIPKLESIASESYIPSYDDMLFTRMPTQGVVIEKYIIQGIAFEMYDVAGQRNQRKKWIHCFEGVTSIIFVASLTDYNSKLTEDENTNRMVISKSYS